MSPLTPDHQRWLQALDAGRFGAWDLDPRLELVHYSPKWKAHLGFPRLAAADSTSFWRCRVHPTDVDAMMRSLRAHLDGGADHYSACFRLRSNGSGYRTMVSRGRVVERDASGAALRMVGTMVDLTPRPAANAGHGLAAEDPHAEAAQPAHGRAPLHLALGLGLGAAVAESMGLIDRVADLLDLALRDAGVAA